MVGMRRAFSIALLVLFPALAVSQIVTPRTPPDWLMKIGAPRDSADTTHQGVFLELGGAGGLYSLSYEHKLGANVMAQAGFTKWSVKFLGPKQAKTAAVATVMRQFHLFDRLTSAAGISESVTLEAGGGIAAGRRTWEEEAQMPTAPVPLDSTFEVWKLRRSPYLALTSLVGVRVNGEGNHDITWRVSAVPMLRLRDAPDARWMGIMIALSAGYTW
jgi:hypothetical protein